MGIERYRGKPFVVTGVVDDGSAANELPVIAGNLAFGVQGVEQMGYTLGLYTETNPGAVTMFARGHFEHAMQDTAALAAMIVKA